MRHTRVRTIKINLEYAPEDVDEEDIAKFVYNAVTSWGGQFHPSDPLFHSLPVKSVQCGKEKVTS